MEGGRVNGGRRRALRRALATLGSRRAAGQRVGNACWAHGPNMPPRGRPGEVFLRTSGNRIVED